MGSKGERQGYLQLNDIEGQNKDKVPQKQSFREGVDEDDESFALLIGLYFEVVPLTIKQSDHFFLKIVIKFIKLHRLVLFLKGDKSWQYLHENFYNVVMISKVDYQLDW